jgi:hypothetical protein
MTTPSFDDLQRSLRSAVEQHFRLLCERYSPEQLYGYSLYTDDNVSSIGPVANTVDGIPSGGIVADQNYYRFGPHEWTLFDDFELFSSANEIVKAIHEDKSRNFSEKRTGMLNAAFLALKELDSDGLFGPRSSGRYIVLWVVDSDEPLMAVSAAALNSSEVFHAFCSAYRDGA